MLNKRKLINRYIIMSMTLFLLLSLVPQVALGNPQQISPFSTPALAGNQMELEAALRIPAVHITLTGDFNIVGPVIVPAGTSATITGDYTISVVSGNGLFVPSGA